MNNITKLKVGDSIGIFSPSSPITYSCPNRFRRAKGYLQSKGFKIIEGSLTEKYDFYRSGSIMQRAEELNNLIRLHLENFHHLLILLINILKKLLWIK